MKVVINDCYGGFGLSLKGQKEYLKLIGKEAFFYKQTAYSHNRDKEEHTKIGVDEGSLFSSTFTKDFGDTHGKWKKADWKYHFMVYDIERTDPNLIAVVEKLGEEANGSCSSLKIVEIPEGINWEINDYDGMESIDEAHRSWY